MSPMTMRTAMVVVGLTITMLSLLAPSANAFAVSQLVNNVMANPILIAAESVNGDTYREIAADVDEFDDDLAVSCFDNKISDTEEPLVVDPAVPFAPPLTYNKWLTMTKKRVPVVIQYTADNGLKPYFMTVAKKIKDAHPDVLLDRRILPAIKNESDEEPTFEVKVDGKVVAARNRRSSETSVFVNMQEVSLAITRARRKRRPATSYGDE